MNKIKEAMSTLKRSEIHFTTANSGMHIMVSHQCRRIDFWPTTGKWIERGLRDRHGRGLSELIAHVREAA